MRIKTLNTIELSSKCDNRCEYCPAKDQHKWRETGFMDFATFERAIKWATYLCGQGTQREINLFGIGESTLHPELVRMVQYARNNLPFRQRLHLNTNGNTMTEKLARELKSAGITSIDVTVHRMKSAARCIRIFRKVGIGGAISIDPVTSPNDWAGQVDWFKYEGPPIVCPWLQHGQATVQSDGSVTICCWDAKSQSRLGHIFDDITKFRLKPFKLCETCHQTIEAHEGGHVREVRHALFNQ